MTYRALELLSLPANQPAFLLDIGCGSGLSGEILDDGAAVGRAGYVSMSASSKRKRSQPPSSPFNRNLSDKAPSSSPLGGVVRTPHGTQARVHQPNNGMSQRELVQNSLGLARTSEVSYVGPALEVGPALQAHRNRMKRDKSHGSSADNPEVL